MSCCTQQEKLYGNRKRSKQNVRNVGFYYVCYELSKRGWNVLRASRNTKGIDLVVRNQRANKTLTIKVKSLTEKTPVPFGRNLDNLIAEYVIICRRVYSERPEIFIVDSNQVKEHIHKGEKDGRISYWLQPKDYEEYKDRWDTIGDGFA